MTSSNEVAQNNLATLLEQSGRLNEAIALYQRSIAIQASSGQARHTLRLAQAHTNLANALLKKGDIDDSIAEGLIAKKLQPRLTDAYTALGNAHLQKSAIGEAIAYYEKSLKLSPDSIIALNNLALILATSTDGQFRDGLRAIELAKHANALSNGKNADIMRTLASAYAEAGQFGDAVAAGQQASSLAKAQRNLRLASEIDFDVDLYRVNLPGTDDELSLTKPFTDAHFLLIDCYDHTKFHRANGLAASASNRWAQPEIDFSNYNVPLYAQIVNRIKAKVSARLGKGQNPHDRYFIIPFAYQNRANDPTIFAFVYLSDSSVCR